MKKALFLCPGIIAVAIITISFAPKDCNKKNWGTKTLYPPADTTAVASPAGYEPAFINYVGRHGARHATGMEEAVALQRLLQLATTTNDLTADGVQLQQRLGNLITVEGKYTLGTLTITGENELQAIGRRMKAHYPGIADNTDAAIKVVTTKQKRTKQSAAAFMKGLGRPLDNDANIAQVENDSVGLRFYEIAPGYRSFVKGKSWSGAIDKINASDKGVAMAAQITKKFFKPAFADKIIAGQLSDAPEGAKAIKWDAAAVADAIFSVASVTNALANEAVASSMSASDIDIASLLSCDEFNWQEFVNSAKDFLVKGPGSDLNGIQVRNAAPLLVDFINTTDSFIQYHNKAAILRFAHAETMSPFAALLQIDGAANTAKDIMNYDKGWQAGQVIPFSANMQWILYKPKDGKGDYLVTILYNEKPVSIPVKTSKFPFYNWKDVRSFYIQKLQALHIDIREDMYAYLLKL